MAETGSSKGDSQITAASRSQIVYQTLDDAAYEPPGNISAKSGEKKKITKPESSCRLTKIAVVCSHTAGSGGDQKASPSQKSSAEKKGDEEENCVRVDPKLYESVPYQVVAPVTPKTTKAFAAKYHSMVQTLEFGQQGKVTKWVNEKLTELHKTAGTVHKKLAEWNDKIGAKNEVKSETIAVTIEGYFCEGEHPKVTVKEVGRAKKKSDSVADIGKDEKEVEVLDGPPDQENAEGSQASQAADKKTSSKDDKGEASADKEKSSSEPVLTTKECWFKVGSLMPKYKSLFFFTNYVHPRWVSPNVYEIHVETCNATRIVYVEAFYNARWEVEFGRVVRGKSDTEEEADSNAISTYDGSAKSLKEEIQAWHDALKSGKSGSFLNVLFQIVRAVKTLLEDYKLTLKQRGQGPRVKKEISSEQLLKLVTVLEGLDKTRKSLEKSTSEGDSSWEIPGGHKLECKLLVGTVKSNWYHREESGRRVRWYYDTAVNLTLLEADYCLTASIALSWLGNVELKGTGKLAISMVAKGKFSSDSGDKEVGYWKGLSGDTIAWWQKRGQSKQVEDKKADSTADEKTEAETEASPGVREGIPIKCECQPEVELEIPVFLEELFNLSPKAEGGLKAGGFMGFDEDGPCVRLGTELEDLKVSLEISALGGWINFTLGPVPIIPLEALSKKAAKSVEKSLGVSGIVTGTQFRFPPLPKQDEPVLDTSKLPVPQKTE